MKAILHSDTCGCRLIATPGLFICAGGRMASALGPGCAANGRQGRHPWTLRHIPDGEAAVTVRIARLPCGDPGKPRISKPVGELSGESRLT